MFETWAFDGLPGSSLHVALYTDVTNCRYLCSAATALRLGMSPIFCYRELQDKVKAGEVDPETAFINASVVGLHVVLLKPTPSCNIQVLNAAAGS